MTENDIHDFYERFIDTVDDLDYIPDDEDGDIIVREKLYDAYMVFLDVFNGEYA